MNAHLYYLGQRSDPRAGDCTFVWIDDNWPTPTGELLRTVGIEKKLLAAPEGISFSQWITALARISYCTEIGIDSYEAIDAVLETVRRTNPACVDRLSWQRYEEILFEARKRLEEHGLLSMRMALINKKTSRSNIETALREQEK